MTARLKISQQNVERRSLSPVLVIWDGGQRWVEAVDVERHVALITQQLHVSVLLPPTHAAGTETALCVRVGLAVLTLRTALSCSIHKCKHMYEQNDNIMVFLHYITTKDWQA